MRKATFEVSPEIIVDFAEKLTEMELDNSIVGKTDDDEIEIEIRYEKDEAKQIDELENYLNELNESLSDEEEDDEDEDND
jgi:outer membrane receptor for Fe3+-dicitrate